MPKTQHLLILLLVTLTVPGVSGALTPQGLAPFDQVLINSQDWQDIYQGFLFARLVDVPVDFIITPGATDDVIASLPQEKDAVLLLQQNRQEQQANVDSLLERQGFNVTVLESRGPLGPRLARALPLEHVYITDDRYPYNAVSLAPFALQQESFVLFTASGDNEALISYLEEEDPTITIYGFIDAQAAQAMESYSPNIIDKGGKFANNLYVVKAYLEEDPKEQVMLTNGEFLEEGLLTKHYPTLFIGRNVVPPEVESFLANSDVESGVLIGNHLTDLATTLKRGLQQDHDKELIVVVKFAKTPRVIETQFSTPVSLEYFPLPINEPNVTIATIAYNRHTKQLEVTYENPSLITVFFEGSIRLVAGDDIITVGDDETNMIASGQQKTILYDADPQGLPSLTGEARIYYGAYPQALEYLHETTIDDLPVIDVADASQLSIKRIIYDKLDKAFYIKLENPGDVGTYANVELEDVIIDGLPTTIGTQKKAYLSPGEVQEVYIRAKLTPLDILENDEVLTRAYYGSREDVLVKTTEKTFELEIRTFKQAYLLGAAVIVVILLLLLLFLRKKPYACDRCGEKIRARSKPYRHECGGRFKRAR